MAYAYIIADDLTGALDAGSALAGQGVAVQVYSSFEQLCNAAQDDDAVHVLDAGYRHLPPEDAAARLRPIAQWLASQHTQCYLKTDSGLRGPIGIAFDVFLSAYSRSALAFVPAFPALQRTTDHGVQYIQGVPLGQSVYARDPLNPVRHSDIAALLQVDTALKIHHANTQGGTLCAGCVTVFDAQTDGDLHTIAQRLSKEPVPLLLAGCAGFAAELSTLWQLPCRKTPLPALQAPIAVFSATASVASIAQLVFAKDHGIACHVMTIDEAFFVGNTNQVDPAVSAFQDDIRQVPLAIFTATPTQEGKTRVDAIMQNSAMGMEQACAYLTEAFACQCAQILLDNKHILPSVFGGDTLIALLRKLHFCALKPIAELLPGIVYAQVTDDLGVHGLITKSGQFGQEDLIVRLADMISPAAG